MFHIGDKVVYPMHGAGIIEKIEEKEILGQIKSYYILNIPYNRMQVMVPLDTCEETGLRAIVDKKEIKKVLTVLAAPSTKMDDNWNRRVRDNTEKIKTGDPKQVAEVIRNLVRIEREKKLSSGEKKLLASAKQVLSSEIVFVENISAEEADSLIEKTI